MVRSSLIETCRQSPNDPTSPTPPAGAGNCNWRPMAGVTAAPAYGTSVRCSAWLGVNVILNYNKILVSQGNAAHVGGLDVKSASPEIKSVSLAPTANRDDSCWRIRPLCKSFGCGNRVTD